VLLPNRYPSREQAPEISAERLKTNNAGSVNGEISLKDTLNNPQISQPTIEIF